MNKQEIQEALEAVKYSAFHGTIGGKILLETEYKHKETIKQALEQALLVEQLQEKCGENFLQDLADGDACVMRWEKPNISYDDTFSTDTHEILKFTNEGFCEVNEFAYGNEDSHHATFNNSLEIMKPKEK